MARGILIGVVIGVVLASVSFKVIERSRVRTTEKSTPSLPEATSASSKSATSAASETVLLRNRVRELEERIANLGGGSPVRREEGRAAGAKSWKSLATRLLALREKIRGKKFGEWPAEAKSLELELISMIASLGQADGLTLDETLRSPDGLPALLLEMVAGNEAERARLGSVLDSAREKWKAYVDSRDQLSRLEQRRAMIDLNDATLGALLGALGPEQSEIAKSISLFDMGSDEGPSTWTEGNREKVTANLLGEWTSNLKLDESSSTALRPVVEDYMRRFQEMQQGFWKRRQAGEDVPRREEALARLALMIETHRRIAGAVPLSADQSKALREWSTIYGCNVYEQ